MSWTADIVAEWIVKSLETAKALPDDRPAGYRGFWPEIVRRHKDGDRAGEETKLGRRTTDQESLHQYDMVQVWMRSLKRRTVKGIWHWARGASDRWIGRKLRIDHKTVKTHREKAFRLIARRMNRIGQK